MHILRGRKILHFHSEDVKLNLLHSRNIPAKRTLSITVTKYLRIKQLIKRKGLFQSMVTWSCWYGPMVVWYAMVTEQRYSPQDSQGAKKETGSG
jgi:hypothetical protein